MAQFEPAIVIVLRNEGGLSDDKDDPGGLTKYGISSRSYPSVDIANLTIDAAKKIYKRDFWDKFAYHALENQVLANKLFDISVNVGTKRAHTVFQRAINFHLGEGTVDEDGWVGHKTVRETNRIHWEILLYTFQIFMGQFYLNLRKEKYIKGWLRRLMN